MSPLPTFLPCPAALPPAPTPVHKQIVCDGMYSGFRRKLTISPSIHHPSFFIGLLLKVGAGRWGLGCAAHDDAGTMAVCSLLTVHALAVPPHVCASRAPLQDCPLPYSNYGHVILGRPSPILFYPISKTEVGPGAGGGGRC